MRVKLFPLLFDLWAGVQIRPRQRWARTQRRSWLSAALYVAWWHTISILPHQRCAEAAPPIGLLVAGVGFPPVDERRCDARAAQVVGMA